MDLRQGTCSSCEHSFRVPATITAARVRCPRCKAVVELSPARPAAASAEGLEAKRPRRAGAGAAKASEEGAAEGAGPSGARHRHAQQRSHAPPKKSPLPLVIGGVALVVLLAAVALFKRGGSEPPPAVAPAVVQKPDFSALPDLEPAEGTSLEAWAQMTELMTQYTTPPFDKASERSGDLMMHKGKAGVPAILNAFKRLDLTTHDGRDIGWKMQTLLLQGLCGVNFGWRNGNTAEDVAFNAQVVERWCAAWNRAKLDDAAWAQIAQEAAQAPAQ